jgi:hypothetical protein
LELKDGDIYEQINSKLKFTLKQETSLSWSLSLNGINGLIDYPIYSKNYMISLLEKNFRKVDNNA